MMTDGEKSRQPPQAQLPQQDGLLVQCRSGDIPWSESEGKAGHAQREGRPVGDPTRTRAGEPIMENTPPNVDPIAAEGMPLRAEHDSTVYKLHPRANEGGQDQGDASRLFQEPGAQYNFHSSQESHNREIRHTDHAHDTALRERDHQIAALHREIEELRNSATRRERRYNATRSELDAAISDGVHQKKQIEEAHRRCRQGEDEVEKLRTLLRDRTEEVKVAQAFMTMADRYSLAEVCQMVEQLNNEIYQCAMDVSDAVRNLGSSADRMHGEDWKGRMDEARHNLRKWDKQVVDRLELDLKHDDPDTTLFECMVQHLFTVRCHDIIQAFCPKNKTIDGYLWDLWENIAASRETSIARNWLAITRGTLRLWAQPPASRRRLLLQLSGMITLGSREPPTATWLEELIGGKLEEMASKALKVKEAVAEGVLSADLEVFAEGKHVDFNPTEMRDAFESPNKPRPSVAANGKGEIIICGTELGVCRIRRELHPPASSGVRKTKEVILKPKVLLHSTLIE